MFATSLDDLRLLYPALLAPQRVWSRTEVLASPSPIPKSPGIYAWYFKNIPPLVPAAGALTVGGLTLLYLGISPKALATNGSRASQQSLRSRLQYHMRGNADGSTLRLTLGCLLAEELDIELRRVGRGKRLTFCDGESRLSKWLDENAFVTWEATTEPWLLETALIRAVSLPLNLDQNRAHPFRATLSEIRCVAREAARRGPIWPADGLRSRL